MKIFKSFLGKKHYTFEPAKELIGEDGELILPEWAVKEKEEIARVQKIARELEAKATMRDGNTIDYIFAGFIEHLFYGYPIELADSAIEIAQNNMKRYSNSEITSMADWFERVCRKQLFKNSDSTKESSDD